MGFALVVNVAIGDRKEDAERILREQVIPMSKSLDGFQSGVWLRSQDGQAGLGIVVFDSEANAKSALETFPSRRPPDAPPVTSAAVFEVTGQA
jgi:hypothetical protein